MPVCRKCVHYFITHEPEKPYGCRAMGFKSRRNPALVVFESSGIQCQVFKVKKSVPRGSGGDIIA
jgi:hypothetical protein